MIDETLTMIPGPTPVHPRILAALARPTVSHVSPMFTRAFAQALTDFRTLCQSETGKPFIVAGSGTLAMEMALVNVAAPGQAVLVISHGYFGDRYAELASAFGIRCDVLRSEWGRAVPPEEVAKKLASTKYAAVTITHVDTSTGTASPVEAYCALLKGRDEIVILDGRKPGADSAAVAAEGFLTRQRLGRPPPVARPWPTGDVPRQNAPVCAPSG